MLEVLTVLVGIFDIATAILAAGKYWRVSVSVLLATTVIVILCIFMKSPVIRWIVGFHIFIAVFTFGMWWESKKGKLK